MKLKDKVVVITGGATGIGAALARRFHAEGAKAIAVAGFQEDLLKQVAAEVDGLAVPCDVSRESEIQDLISKVDEAEWIDLLQEPRSNTFFGRSSRRKFGRIFDVNSLGF